MLNEEKYGFNDLVSHDWQYSVRFYGTSCFNRGEKVFLSSNPEIEMTVSYVDEKMVSCYWKDIRGQLQFSDFYPWTILHYEFRVLIIYYEKYKVCLN